MGEDGDEETELEPYLLAFHWLLLLCLGRNPISLSVAEIGGFRLDLGVALAPEACEGVGVLAAAGEEEEPPLAGWTRVGRAENFS